ncbi:MAG: acyl carrier protein [Actinophytocola sp.]|uniref:acyl carrier protein n=1 Tax=Actinophytocola sp. TaxID=1872138 RepID=UPI003C741C1F
MPEIFAGVAGLVGQVTDVPADQITEDAQFDLLANWSSFAALRLLAGIEEQFGIRLDLQRYFAIRDVGGLVAAVSAKMVRHG